MNRIKKIIMDSYEAAEEYYTFEGATMKTEYNEICKDILNMFYIEKLHLDNRYKAGRISKSDLFMDWMQGLPTAFPVADDIFLHSAVDFLGDLRTKPKKKSSVLQMNRQKKDLFISCIESWKRTQRNNRKSRNMCLLYIDGRC